MSRNYDEIANYYDTADLSEEISRSESETPERPSFAAEPMDSFTVRLPVSVLEKVRRVASDRNVSTGAALREIIEAAVAESTDDNATIPVSVLREVIARAEAPGRRIV